jgi:hypothetical protein
MMEAQSPRWGRFALIALACFTVALLASASSALAVQSSQYEPFENPTSCPTSSPFMNDPAFPEVACVASSAAHLSLKLGSFETEANSPTTVRFALAPGNPALQEKCPEECYRAVPSSTVLDAQPFEIDLTLPGHHKPPHVNLPPFHRGSDRGHGQGGPWHGHGRFVHRRKLLHSIPDASIEATMEAAGDVHGFSFSVGPGGQTPLFSLPLKIHLEGGLLGDDCYIGSNANPIDLASFLLSEPELGFLEDPNGLPVLTLILNGLDIGNNIFSVPAAQGCGPSVGFGKYKHNPFDDAIDSMLGLPSPSGQNLLALTGSKTGVAFSFTNGGALQAAFDAAKQP